MKTTCVTSRNAARVRLPLSAVLTAVLLAPGGCSVYDHREDCPQGIHVAVYSKTDCAVDTLYPEAVSELTFYLFDENERLVSVEGRGVSTPTDWRHTLDASNGLYTVVATSGINPERFETTPSAADKTVVTKDDLMMQLRHTGGTAASLDGTRIFYGESRAVSLPDPAEYGSVFRTAAVNLQEQTNRITVTVEGLARAEGYEVAIETVGGAMSYDGQVRESEPIEYPATATVERGVLRSNFTTLALATGFRTMLVVRNRVTRAEVYRGDLLGTLLLKNPEVNLACDHDFHIAFTAVDRCDCGVYTMLEIRVNNWLVHSYDHDF